jgi:hypothetical protein
MNRKTQNIAKIYTLGLNFILARKIFDHLYSESRLRNALPATKEQQTQWMTKSSSTKKHFFDIFSLFFPNIEN